MRIPKILAFALPLLAGCTPVEKSSIGIIGGADGPTAIFVATQMLKPIELLLCGVLLAALIVGVVLLIRRFRKK